MRNQCAKNDDVGCLIGSELIMTPPILRNKMTGLIVKDQKWTVWLPPPPPPRK